MGAKTRIRVGMNLVTRPTTKTCQDKANRNWGILISNCPKNPGPQTDRVLRARTPAMEGPTPAMESLTILRVLSRVLAILGGPVPTVYRGSKIPR